MKNLEWKENKPVVDTLELAKELSIAKWEYIVKNNGSTEYLVKNIPQLDKLAGRCGLCHLATDFDDGEYDCYIDENHTKCPLMVYNEEYEAFINCNGIDHYFEEANGKDEDEIEDFDNHKKDHPWHNWQKNRTKKNAQAVLNLIKKIKIL